jgi:acetaldehyde dehydrogenase (acetylating)
VKDWQEGCERCKQILQYGGMGHTMAIHSRNEDVILQFGLKKPAFRIVVNTPTTLGSIGLTTGLDPAMTLGCGGWGGNITSDNISPLHLINVKRLAYEIRPARPAEAAAGTAAGSAAPLATRVDAFLGSRGFRAEARTEPAPPASERLSAASAGLPSPRPESPAPAPPPVAFVCEDDVRAAAKEGRRIVLGPKTIVTPSARDAGEALRLFDMQA